MLALQRHRVGFGLPALLQCFHGVNAQHGRGTQHSGLFNQGAAACRAFGLSSLQAGMGGVHHVFPDGLDIGKGFFAQVTGFAPALGKSVQFTHLGFPVGALGVRCGPGLQLFDDGEALGLVGIGLLAHLGQPGFHHFVGFGAGFVKPFPQRVVGLTALVGGFPLVAQAAQGFLHLAPTHALAFRGLQQRLGLGHQLFTQLIGTPALPTFQLSRLRQRSVRTGFLLGGHQTAVALEHGAHIGGRFGCGLAVAFGQLAFEHGQCFVQIGRHAGPLLLGGLRVMCGFFSGHASVHAAGSTQFVSPHGHGGQRRLRVGVGGHGLGQGGLKGVPHQLQLVARSLQHGWKLHFHAGPLGVLHQGAGLLLPMRHVAAKGFGAVLSFAPGLGGQHFNALRDQHRGFTLHLHPVLQVFNGLHALSQGLLQGGQRLAGQRRASAGSVALPGQGIGQVQAGMVQQSLGFLRPFHTDLLLRFLALEFVELFLQRLGRTAVAVGQFFEHLVHELQRRVGGQPFADACCALARCGCGEGATRHGVQRVGCGGFGLSGCVHGRFGGVGLWRRLAQGEQRHI